MFKRIMANLFDEVVVVAIAAVLLGITILVLKLLGWKFGEPFYAVYAAFIIAAVVNLFYYPIMDGVFKSTLGKKLLNIA